MFLQITFLLAIDGFRRQFDNYIPRIICDWLTTSDKITVLVYHELSVWQKLQLFLLAKKNAPYDLKMSAEEFETIAEVSNFYSLYSYINIPVNTINEH